MDDGSPSLIEDLPEELVELVKPELEPGERLLWASRSCVISPSINPWPSVTALVWFTGFAATSVGCLSMVTNKNPGSDGFFGVVGLLSGVIVFFFVIGFVSHFFSKQNERRKLAGQIYALTDRRAIIWIPTKNLAFAVHTYQRGMIKSDLLHRIEYPDGSGDVRLCGHPSFYHSGFQGIADVRRVEQLVRRFLIASDPGSTP